MVSAESRSYLVILLKNRTRVYDESTGPSCRLILGIPPTGCSSNSIPTSTSYGIAVGNDSGSPRTNRGSYRNGMHPPYCFGVKEQMELSRSNI